MRSTCTENRVGDSTEWVLRLGTRASAVAGGVCCHVNLFPSFWFRFPSQAKEAFHLSRVDKFVFWD